MYIISLTLSTNLTDDNPHDKFYAKKIFFICGDGGGGETGQCVKLCNSRHGWDLG